MARFHWHGALRSAHKSRTHGHVSWKKGGGKRELVSAPWTSSRRFSHVLWLKAHNHRLLRACLLGSKRKLPPPACQTQLKLPFVVCCLRGVQFTGSVYTYNQGPLSSCWAHCISYAPSAYSLYRRCCCCPLQCDKQRMGTRLNSAGDPVHYHRSWSLSFLHLLSVLSPPLLLSRSRVFWQWLKAAFIVNKIKSHKLLYPVFCPMLAYWIAIHLRFMLHIKIEICWGFQMHCLATIDVVLQWYDKCFTGLESRKNSCQGNTWTLFCPRKYLVSLIEWGLTLFSLYSVPPRLFWRKGKTTGCSSSLM